MMNLHSLCPKLLIRAIKAKDGKRRDRMRWSAANPTKDRGKDPRSSFGRYEVIYVRGGDVCSTS